MYYLPNPGCLLAPYIIHEISSNRVIALEKVPGSTGLLSRLDIPPMY
jgi:hypothetical protein